AEHNDATLEILKSLVALHERKGNKQQALDYFKQYSDTKDTIAAHASRIKIATLEAERAIDLKDKELQENSLKFARQKNERALMVGGLLLLSVVLLLFYRNYNNQKRMTADLAREKQRVQQQAEELNDKNIALNATLDLVRLQKKELETINDELSQFAHVLAHDIKSPCNNIFMGVQYLRDLYSDVLADKDDNIIDLLEGASSSIVKMVDGILQHTVAVNKADLQKTEFTFSDLMNEVRSLLSVPEGFTFHYINGNLLLKAPRYGLLQIILNLCTNALKYNDKADGQVEVTAQETNDHFLFTVEDNGKGISENDQQVIFELFRTLDGTDRNNNKGYGIGLSTVKRLAEKLGGSISVTSVPGKGSTFTVLVSK
ncbi:MAG: sensor histidine kinase, partial [Chitinophagia bacterium]|nr:sensor histidine kinase [Chitinophagia bacterium]